MIQPIMNNVLVRAHKIDSLTVGGIIVPESHRPDGCKVDIVAVGKGTKKRPMHLKAGQRGYRVWGAGTPVEHNGEKFYLIEDKAIIALES